MEHELHKMLRAITGQMKDLTSPMKDPMSEVVLSQRFKSSLGACEILKGTEMLLFFQYRSKPTRAAVEVLATF